MCFNFCGYCQWDLHGIRRYLDRIFDGHSLSRGLHRLAAPGNLQVASPSSRDDAFLRRCQTVSNYIPSENEIILSGLNIGSGGTTWFGENVVVPLNTSPTEFYV